jgi:hypothetical protein
MNKYYIVIFLLSVFSSLSFSQTSLKGRVVDMVTNQPLDYATVYVNSTTNGTVTNQEGYFELKNIEFPAQIVVSHVSYDSYTFEMKHELPETVYKLKERSFELNEVLVTDVNKRKQNLKLFIENFLGTDKWGKNAKILNSDILIFDWKYEKRKVPPYLVKTAKKNKHINNLKYDRDSNFYYTPFPKKMIVYAKEPLKISLPALGYQLRYDMVSFKYEFSKKWNSYYCQYVGYNYFEEVKFANFADSLNAVQNRQEAFYNSPQHFLRAIYNKELKQNGYRLINRIVTPAGKERLQRFSTDSLILKDEKFADIYNLKDRDIRILYYVKHGKPVNLLKDKSPIVIQSSVKFLDDVCRIRSNGTTSGESIVFGTEIGNKKIGALLPDNYKVR